MMSARGGGLQPAQHDEAGAGLGLGELAGKAAGADGDGGDRRDGDRRAEPHHKGRGDADPEQPLRQREHQHDDGARAGPQADGEDGGKAAAQPVLAAKLARLRRVRMAPGVGLVAVVVVMMRVRMAVAVIVVMMVVRVIVRMTMA